MHEELTIYCADIGSVAKGRFGWARLAGEQAHMGSCIVAFVDDIACTLAKGRKVALGFECPLWVPVPENPQYLTKGRQIDGNRPWSAGAGTAVLATGVSQVAWILEELRSRLNQRDALHPSVHLDWTEFEGRSSALFIWEAFVTGKAKASGSKDAVDARDALTACWSFSDLLPDLGERLEPEQRVRSLIGGAILWAGWSEDLGLLGKQCIVVRPQPQQGRDPQSSTRVRR